MTEVTIPRAHYFNVDLDKLNPIYFEPKILVNILGIDPKIYSKINKECKSLVLNSKLSLNKEYGASIASSSVWYCNGKYYDGSSDPHKIKEELGCLVIAFMFPIEFPQSKIDEVIKKYKIESHQNK